MDFQGFAKGQEMEAFILAGSTSGAGRTTASLLLALGMSKLGLDTLHIQVTGGDDPPLLQDATDLPFATAWFAPTNGRSMAAEIRARIPQSPEPAAVVVDLPASKGGRGSLADPAFRFLLLMSTGRADVECAARDFHDMAGATTPLPLALPWILPVGWPYILRPADYEPILDRVLRRSRIRPPPSNRVIQPGGIPMFDLRSEPLLLGGRIALSPLRAKAAEVIAYAVLKATGSSLIEFPEDAF